MNRTINEMKSKYGELTVYPPVKYLSIINSYNLRGNTYSI